MDCSTSDTVDNAGWKSVLGLHPMRLEEEFHNRSEDFPPETDEQWFARISVDDR